MIGTFGNANTVVIPAIASKFFSTNAHFMYSWRLWSSKIRIRSADGHGPIVIPYRVNDMFFRSDNFIYLYCFVDCYSSQTFSDGMKRKFGFTSSAVVTQGLYQNHSYISREQMIQNHKNKKRQKGTLHIERKFITIDH